MRGYYESRAQFWELQSLDPGARNQPGRLRYDFVALAQELWREAGGRPDLVRQIESMLVRIANDRGSGNDFYDFKTGIGGMIEARVFGPGFADAARRSGNQTSLLATEKLAAEESSGANRRGPSAKRLQLPARAVSRSCAAGKIEAFPTCRRRPRKKNIFARRMKCATIEEFRLPYGKAREKIRSLRLRYLVE